MRLVCPNCDAQYEVDDAAIPEAGRDVQCSNCGHAWFQRPPEIEAEEEFEEEIFLSDDEVVPPPPPPPAPPPVEPAPAAAAPPPRAEYDDDEDDDVPPPPAPPAAAEEPPRKPALDEALLAVLREEAEREAAVRQAEAPKTAPVAAEPAPSAVPAAPPPVPPSVLAARERFADLSVDREDEPEEEEVVVRPSRRELLPDIEEINSTLRASSEPRGADEDLPLPPVIVVDDRRGFRSGFTLMLLIAAGLWLAYVMAPRISTQIPASASMLDAYVGVVDKARVSVDSALQSASKSIRSLSGQDG